MIRDMLRSFWDGFREATGLATAAGAPDDDAEVDGFTTRDGLMDDMGPFRSSRDDEAPKPEPEPEPKPQPEPPAPPNPPNPLGPWAEQQGFIEDFVGGDLQAVGITLRVTWPNGVAVLTDDFAGSPLRIDSRFSGIGSQVRPVGGARELRVGLTTHEIEASLAVSARRIGILHRAGWRPSPEFLRGCERGYLLHTLDPELCRTSNDRILVCSFRSQVANEWVRSALPWKRVRDCCGAVSVDTVEDLQNCLDGFVPPNVWLRLADEMRAHLLFVERKVEKGWRYEVVAGETTRNAIVREFMRLSEVRS